jgi:peptidase E
MRLLLISNTYAYKGGYLEHCADELRAFLGDRVRRVTFVPFAGHDYTRNSQLARDSFLSLGYTRLLQKLDASVLVYAATFSVSA